MSFNLAAMQQTWQTPAWGVSLFILGVLAKYAYEQLKRQTSGREAAEAKVYELKENRVLDAVAALASKVTDLKEDISGINRKIDTITRNREKDEETLKSHEERFAKIEEYVREIEDDVHTIKNVLQVLQGFKAPDKPEK